MEDKRKEIFDKAISSATTISFGVGMISAGISIFLMDGIKSQRGWIISVVGAGFITWGMLSVPTAEEKKLLLSMPENKTSKEEK